MRLWVTGLLLASSVLFGSSRSWGETSLLKAFFEQREIVATVFFARGSSKLDRVATAELESTLARIRQSTCDAHLIRIEGFSGQEGSAENAFRLSLKRADSVARFLRTKGVNCLAGINGYGDLQASPPAGGKALRVEIAAYAKMSLFDFDSARHIDARKVIQP